MNLAFVMLQHSSLKIEVNPDLDLQGPFIAMYNSFSLRKCHKHEEFWLVLRQVSQKDVVNYLLPMSCWASLHVPLWHVNDKRLSGHL